MSNNLLSRAKAHVELVTSKIATTKTFVDSQIVYLRKMVIRARGDERDQFEGKLFHQLENQRMMELQIDSPYFVRCDVLLDGEEEQKTWYFGKFPFTQESIYSWVTPAATIRFDAPGRFSYITPEGREMTGTLIRKDQFLIVNKNILFMATENTDEPRKLVYQEYFSQKKEGFALQEIVEQMEKAQDTIIRAHHQGSFLISGPAGSGKTTLALHRVAFLVQSPDTAHLFPEKDIVVFVQDKMTQEYFSKLLPSLGIYGVTITTFDQWAMQLLGISNMSYATRYVLTEDELEQDAYEYAKYKAIQSLALKQINIGDLWNTLQSSYAPYFSSTQQEYFDSQKSSQTLDRFDLTLLLKLMMQKEGRLVVRKEQFTKSASGKFTKKIIDSDIAYSLMVIDEAENYLPEQLQILKSCSKPLTQAMIYVGDLVQQTLPFTIKQWGDIQEHFVDERKVILQKVYRNTKQILQYIQSEGYTVDIPDGVKEGESVEEISHDQVQELIKGKHKNNSSIGILAKSEKQLAMYKNLSNENENVHCLTINEAQGVEFDTVFLLDTLQSEKHLSHPNTDLQKEREKVNKDLRYVALTRAIEKMYIVTNS